MKKNIRVLQILPELNVGGVETGTVDFAKYLKDHGYHSVVMSNGGDLVKDLEAHHIRHYSLPVHKKNPWTAIACIRKVREVILREGITIVHARSRVPAWIAFFACRKTQAQFMTTCHGHYSVQFFSRVMGFPKLIIVPSQVIGRHMIDSFGFPAENVRCIPRSVDLDRFNIRRQEEAGQTPHVITIVGRLTPLKGHAYFLKAMAKVVRSKPYIKVRIVGDAPRKKEFYRQELEVLARHLGLAEHVEFLGRRKDVPQIMASSDVVVMASIEPEAFGRVIIEAQAVGVPVVATQVGGIMEVIDHERTGLLVLPKDTDAMAQAVVRLLDDRTLARQIAANARCKLEENFTLEHMAGQTIRVYQELMEYQNILVIKMTAAGDVVLVTASLKALREAYPRARICCLVDESCKSILQGCPFIDEVMVIDLKGRDRGFWGVLRFARRLAAGHFDKVIDFQNNRLSHVLGWLSFAAHTYGYRNKKFGFLLTDPVENARHDISPVRHQFQVLKILGIPYDDARMLEVFPSKDDQRAVAGLLESEWIGEGTRLVGVNLAASEKWKTKNWPIEKIAKLCDELASKNIRVAITGTEKDQERARQLLTLTRARVANFVGKTSIMQLAVLIRRCRVYVTPDSAPLHIAAAVGTPVMALFGPTLSQRHMPPNRASLVIQKPLDCAGCYNGRFCRTLTHACMNDITVEEILDGIKQWLPEPFEAASPTTGTRSAGSARS